MLPHIDLLWLYGVSCHDGNLLLNKHITFNLLPFWQFFLVTLSPYVGHFLEKQQEWESLCFEKGEMDIKTFLTFLTLLQSFWWLVICSSLLESKSFVLLTGNWSLSLWLRATNVTTHPMETQKRNMNFSRSHYHIFKDLCGKLQFQSWSVGVSLISSLLKWALMMNQVGLSECFSVISS